MKKALVLVLAVLLCMAIALPVGADGTFLGSPGDKDKIKDATIKGLEQSEMQEGLQDILPEGMGVNELALDECLVITTIQEAEEGSTDITQGERDVLLATYKALVDGTESLPIDGEYVVREIVDISFRNEGCRQLDDHGDKDALLKVDGVILTIDYDMGVEPDAEVCVMVYVDGQWKEVEAENNGDGTVTCEFTALCPVAFAVLV